MLKRAHWFGVVGLVAAPAIAAMSWGGCQGTCASSAECGSDEFCSMAQGTCISARPIGFCKAIETDCSGAAVTVCGCDGKTYANACLASLARQSIASLGQCNITCGGSTDVKCAAGTYCHFMDGVCGGGQTSGTCDPIPTSCNSTVPNPVCGCDGKTYDTPCEAQRAGVSITATGACPCGGASGAKCEAGKFCNFATGMCGQAGATGTCTAPPTSCDGLPGAQQVCGCDNKTYDNACLAAKAGVSIFTDTTACACGGATQIECPDGQYCNFDMVGNCLNPNPVGHCAPVPDSCSGVPNYVCGCDNKTYLNACVAAQAGLSVAAQGQCKPSPDAGADGG